MPVTSEVASSSLVVPAKLNQGLRRTPSPLIFFMPKPFPIRFPTCSSNLNPFRLLIKSSPQRHRWLLTFGVVRHVGTAPGYTYFPPSSQVFTLLADSKFGTIKGQPVQRI